jgi:2-oxoglutarate dehydrogenase E2 component (dihydrolipoamide succinyltransferase)
MKTPHVFSASAAAVLAMTMAAFAQAPQGASPSTPASQPAAQAGRQAEAPVTLVGCVMRETEYRKATDSGRGGPAATGVGLGNEFVLVNASKVTSGSTPPAATGQCGAATGGQAYELSGNRERELEKFVGRRIEITGTLKEAKTTAGPGGEPKPTGGFDPLKQDLKLFEVDVTSFRELPANQASAAAPAVPAAAAAAPEPRPAAPAPPAAPAAPAPAAQASPAQPQPSPSTAPRQSLPRTASPLPFAGLIGLLSLASGLALSRRG